MKVDAVLTDAHGTFLTEIPGVDYNEHTNELTEIVIHDNRTFELFFDTSYNTSNGTPGRARNLPVYREASHQNL